MKNFKSKVKYIKMLSLFMIAFLAISFDNVNANINASNNDLSVKEIWASSFGSTSNDQYEAIQMNIDGTYIVAGSTAGNNYDVAGRNHGLVDAILAKYDKDGNVIWSKIVGGSSEDYFSEVKVLKDGRIAAAGYTESSNSGDVTATKYGFDSSWIVMFDADGNKLWTQVNGRSGTYGYTAFRGITETQDGNIVCVGYAYGPGAGNIPGTIQGERDTFIVKFDSSNGNKMWYKFAGGTKNETFFDVAELENGNLVAVGQSESNDGTFAGKNKGGFDAIAIVYSSTGNLEVATTFGGSLEDNFVAVKKTSQNKIVVAGNTFSNDKDITATTYGARDGIFVSFTNEGVYEWQKVVGGNGDDYLTYMSEGQDGNFSVVGYTNSTTSGALNLENKGGYDGLFAVLSKDTGSLEHLVLFGGTGNDNAETVATTDKGGYVVAGHTTSLTFEGLGLMNRGARDGFIAKFKTNNVPKLTAPDFNEITVGESFDLRAGVSAVDFEDGDLTSAVQITSTFNKDVAGVYPIEYKVKDYENNEVTVKSVVLVNNGKYNAGTNTILYANDYTINRGQVKLDKTDVDKRATVKIYSKKTGLLIDNTTDVQVNYGQYKNVIGIYDLVFSLVSEPTTSVTIKANVVKGMDPVLTIKDYTEISLLEPFDATVGLSAIDFEDKNITNKVIITNRVDNEIPGIYEVTYSITDSDYNTVEKTQTVVVKGLDVISGNKYVIEAYDYEIFVGKVNNTDEQIITYSGLKVFDKTTKTYITNPAVTITRNGYTNVLGDYNISISVDDEPTLSTIVKASVVNSGPPAIRGANFVELSLDCTFDPLEDIVLSDDTDDSTTLFSNLEVAGNVDTSTPGLYTLTYTSTDTDGNATVVNRVILVNDGNYAVGQTFIIYAKDYSIKSREVVVDKADIISRSDAKVYRKSTGVIDSSTNLIVDYGTYSSTVDVYPISFKIKTERLLTRVINADVNVGEAPVITGDSIINVAPSTTVDLTKYITATDFEQGNIIGDVVISDNFDPNTVGVYPVTYTVTDIDGNTANFSQIIVVNDGTIKKTVGYFVEYSSFEIDINLVDTSREAILKEAKVRVWDVNTGLEVSNSIIEVDKKDYKKEVGVYPIMLSMSTDRSLYDYITATVTGVLQDFPELTINEYTEINVLDPFDPTVGLSAIDFKDKDITDKVIITNPVNNEIPGIYEVTYSITDSDSNTVVKKQVVVVKGKGITVGTNFVLEAYDFDILAGKVDNTDGQIVKYSMLKVYDKVNKEYVTNPALIINQNGFTGVVGTYPINISLNLEPTLVGTITANVVTGAPPVIKGATFTEISVDGTFNPLDGIMLMDDEDSIATLQSNLVVSGSVNTSVPGFYTVTYTLKDSDFNETVVNRVILINDGNYQVGQTFVIYAKDYSILSKNVIVSNAEVIKNAEAKVYRKSSGLLDRSSQLIVDYGAYSSTVNVYPVSFKIKMERSLTRNINADVNNGKAPVISGDAIINVKPSNTVDISKYISVNDLEDGNMIDKVVMNNDFDPNTVGVYPVSYQVVDSDGNVTNFNQMIVVNDGSIYTTKDYFISYVSFEIDVKLVDTSDAAILENAKVRLWDKKTGLELGLDLVVVDKQKYTNVVGKYPIKLKIKTETSYTGTLTATVTGPTPLPKTGNDLNLLYTTITLLLMSISIYKFNENKKNKL